MNPDPDNANTRSAIVITIEGLGARWLEPWGCGSVRTAAFNRLAAEGLSVRVIDLYRLKPVDDDLLGSALSGTASVVTFEENTRVGALGSIVAEAMARCAVHARLRSFDLRDDVMMGAASRGWAERTYGLGLESLMDALREGTKATWSAVR